MPVIATNIAPGTYESIKALVDGKAYASVEQFIEIALLNQVALERGRPPEEVLHAQSGAKPSEDRRSSGRSKPARAGKRGGKRSRSRRAGAVSRKRSQRATVPPEDLNLTKRRLDLADAVGQAPPTFEATPRPETERLWGQVNRLLPMKIACRWLAVAAIGRDSWPRLEEFCDSMADDAATIGDALEEIDAKNGRKRDHQLATGLPRRNSIPSRDRFVSQYMARVTRRGDIYPGAICSYALASFDADRLSLTDRGLSLAHLPNPVLDGDLAGAEAALDAQERTFLVAQVLDYVPGERADFRLVLSAVLRGSSSPNELLDIVRPELPEDWSPGMFRTHTSGVIARMAEMGLLEREWQGRNVLYHVPEEGKRMLDAKREEEAEA